MADWYKAALEAASGQSTGKDDDLPFNSRRSAVVCRHACVACSQPLASSIGIDMLRRGANAADTAVAMAAAIAVLEPCSTGLGGDMFCLYYDAATKKVHCINGSGKSPSGLDLDVVRKAHPVMNDSNQDNNGSSSSMVNVDSFYASALAVTVPGAAQGWEDLLQLYGSGKFSLSQVLEPAAVLAEEGFPVSPLTSHHWKSGLPQIEMWLPDDGSVPIPLTVDGKRGPEPGEIIVNKDMARVLRDLGKDGAQKGFYQAKTGKAIVEVIQKHGGVMNMDDLVGHASDFPDAISAEYRGCKLWQVPPNGQGIAGLVALTGLQHLEDTQTIDPIRPSSIGTASCYHAMVEMMRLGFADARAHVADSRYTKTDCATLLDKERIRKRVDDLFSPEKATIHGIPDASSCTISFQVVDAEGNAVSFVNSNFMGFGTGIVPEGCGFSLQNRGFGFTLDGDGSHPNILAPSKRPYHTIIPGMLTHTDTGELYATLSNMGGNMQPQGHMQLTVDLLAGGLDPQTAIDTPRFCIADGTQDGAVFFEKGIEEEEVKDLQERGHKMHAGVGGHGRSIFGRANIIKRDRETGVLWAGSDGRGDGCAIGF